MVSGFPYPTPPVRGKVGRPGLSRGPTARSKARQRDEDDDSDFGDGDDVEEGGSRAQGLGFSPTTQYVLRLHSFVPLHLPSRGSHLWIWILPLFPTLTQPQTLFRFGSLNLAVARTNR